MIERLEKSFIKVSENQIKLLTQNLFQDINEKIAITSINEICFISIKDILRLEADGNYTDIFTVKEKLTSSRLNITKSFCLKNCFLDLIKVI